MGVKVYFADAWRCLDALIVLAGAVDIALTSRSSLSALRIVRILRMLRMLQISRMGRLVTRSSEMRDLLESIVRSLSNVWPVVLLLFLFVYMAAIFLMNLYGEVELSSNDLTFENFGKSFLMVFLVVLGEVGPRFPAVLSVCLPAIPSHPLVVLPFLLPHSAIAR